MADRLKGKPQRVEDLAKKAYKVHASADRLIEKHISPGLAPWANLLGNSLFGERDGEWTVNSLLEQTMVVQKEEEKAIRIKLAKQTLQALDAQLTFFRHTESPSISVAQNAAELTTALLQRILASEDDIAYEYAFESEALEEAHAVEAVRQIIMKPAFPLIGDGLKDFRPPRSRDDSFLGDLGSLFNTYEIDLQDERIEEVRTRMKNPSDIEEYRRVHDEWIQEKMKNYTPEKWEELLGQQCRILFRHIQESARRSSESSQQTVGFLNNLTYRGKKIPQKSLEELAEFAEDQKKFCAQIAQLERFDDLLPWIKAQLGENATYMTLLDRLYPIDLEPESTPVSSP